MRDQNNDKLFIWLGPFARCNDANDRDIGLLLGLLWVLFPWIWNIIALWGCIVLISLLF